MDFLEMNFSKLFINKHGKQLFDNISQQIRKENRYEKGNNNYIEIVFKIAFLDFFGLDEFTIKEIIEDTMQVKKINIKEMKSIHKFSIKEIKNYLQFSIQ